MYKDLYKPAKLPDHVLSTDMDAAAVMCALLQSPLALDRFASVISQDICAVGGMGGNMHGNRCNVAHPGEGGMEWEHELEKSQPDLQNQKRQSL